MQYVFIDSRVFLYLFLEYLRYLFLLTNYCENIDVHVYTFHNTCLCIYVISILDVNLFSFMVVRCKKHMNELVLSLAPKFTKLQVLVLRQDKPQLEDNAVEAIANSCHDLQDLDLSKSFKLTDRSLNALAHGCRDLTKLNISGCTSFSDHGLAYLTSFCKKLKILNLCGCVKAATDTALQVMYCFN